MRGLIGALATMETLMLRHGKYLTPFAVCEFRRAYCIYRSALNCLADRACSRQEVRYHFRPKVHFLGHLVWHFLPANPRYYHNYSDEDFIARSKRIAERSHPVHMSRLTLLRYIIHACLRFSGETIWSMQHGGRKKESEWFLVLQGQIFMCNFEFMFSWWVFSVNMYLYIYTVSVHIYNINMVGSF